MPGVFAGRLLTRRFALYTRQRNFGRNGDRLVNTSAELVLHNEYYAQALCCIFYNSRKKTRSGKQTAFPDLVF